MSSFATAQPLDKVLAMALAQVGNATREATEQIPHPLDGTALCLKVRFLEESLHGHANDLGPFTAKDSRFLI